MRLFRWERMRIFLFAIPLVLPCSNLANGSTFQCTTAPRILGRVAAPTIDTLRAVVLYTTDTPPVWWTRVWNPDSQLSVPRFYKDNSFGKYILTAATYAFGAPNPVARLDGSINFADFDNDGPNGIPASQDNCSSESCLSDGWIGDDDGKVDAFFYIVPSTENSGRYPWQDYGTDDFSVGGRQIIIEESLSVGAEVNSEEWGVFVPAHEWGHALGLPDLYGEFDGANAGWWGLGSFSTMAVGMTGLRPAPFDPWSRIRLKWVSPTEVTTPRFGEPIPDFHTTGTVYKLSKNGQEYFLVTNHRGVDPFFEHRAYWEEKFKGYGLMIWHVDTLGCNFVGCGGPPRAYRYVDLELAHGMYDTSNCSTVSPNPVSGLDSLDFGRNKRTGDPCGYSFPDIMSGTCFWNDSSGKTAFDDKSNPSSKAYGVAFTPDLNRVQDVPTFLAVQGIRSPAPFTTAQADLIVNARYGDIFYDTTWGPGVVSVIGDVTVNSTFYSGATLTIDSGTTVFFQSNYDNQRAGADTTKCRIEVPSGSGLIVKGTPTAPVKFVSSRPESLAGTDDWEGIVVKPGGKFSISNAIIRHAYAGIEDSSRSPHTIQNVRIGRCKMYGILAGETDSLTIRGCRVDSINANPGGYGICVYSGNNGKGARLIKDTVWACHKGMLIQSSTTPIETCLVQGAVGWLPSHTGIVTQLQAGSDTLRITATKINGYFVNQHLDNGLSGRVIVTACTLISPSSPSRSPYIIRSTAHATYLRLRGSRLFEWQDMGVYLLHNNGQVANLGTATSPADSGFNVILTGSTSPNWKFVYDGNCAGCATPVIKAEYNCFGANPPASRFSTNIDRTPLDLSCAEAPPKIATGQEKEILPKKTELLQNYPNPFNPTTLIQFNLERAEKVHLEIFNILGQKVRTMLSGEQFTAGAYTFLWDGKDNRGSPLSSGAYFYRLKTPTYLKTNKMMLVK